MLESSSSGLRIGAAVSARTLEQAPQVQTAYRALAESAGLVGSLQVRNLATLGGNLCNAAPSADMAPPLLALDAEAVIAGPGGSRRLPLADFFLGVRRTALGPGELLLELVIPAPGQRSFAVEHFSAAGHSCPAGHCSAAEHPSAAANDRHRGSDEFSDAARR